MSIFKKSVLACAVAVTLSACTSPYANWIKPTEEMCQGGNVLACSEVSRLQIADQQWHEAKRQEVGRVVVGALIVGLAVAAGVAAARGGGGGGDGPPPPPPRQLHCQPSGIELVCQ
jgi:hypothetical protein